MDKEDLLNLIPYGRDKAVSREMLCALTGEKDREVRRMIAVLRKKHVIVSTSWKGGYYQTNNRDEIAHFVAENNSRIYKLNESNRTARNALAVLDGQMVL